MNLKSTRKQLGLSLRDAATVAGVSHQQISLVERGAAGEVATEQIRAAYRSHASKSAQLSLSEQDVLTLKSTKTPTRKFSPQAVTIIFDRDASGEPILRYEADSHELGDACVSAIAVAAGYVATRVKK
jgi:transcriptional regulator with XRE-family HTH domain